MTQLSVAIQPKSMHLSICHDNRVTSKLRVNITEEELVFVLKFVENKPSASNSRYMASKHFGDASHAVL